MGKMKITKEWQEYDRDYQKKMQDIRTKDGTEYIECWPNAGKWIVCSKGIEIPDSEVTHVRLTSIEEQD